MTEGEARTCIVCGWHGPEVTPAQLCIDVGTWTGKPATGVARFTSGPRCRDHQACRDRVEGRGGRWPLIEGPMGRTKGASVASATITGEVDGDEPFDFL